MFVYNYVKNVNSTRLKEEISQAGLASLLHIDTAGTNVYIHFSVELTESELMQLNSIVSAHVLKTQMEYIDEKIDSAIIFGMQTMKDFISENVALGITQRGLTSHVRKTLREVKDALETGSVYDSVTEIRSLDPTALDNYILTPTRILQFRNKIEVFLQVPLAQNWDDPETWL